MNFQIAPVSIGWIIALAVGIVAFISLFVSMNIDTMKFLTILIIGLAVARLT